MAYRETLHKAELERVVTAIRQLQEHGLAAQNVDPKLAAVAIEAMSWRFAESWLVHRELDIDLDEGVAQFFTLLTNALQITDSVP